MHSRLAWLLHYVRNIEYGYHFERSRWNCSATAFEVKPVSSFKCVRGMGVANLYTNGADEIIVENGTKNTIRVKVLFIRIFIHILR